jgi:chorismate dehydratase
LAKIKVGAVSYLNTKPLLYGFKHHSIRDKIELLEDYPAKVAQQLIDGKIDIGLVPVAVIPQLKEWHIVGDYCIGCDGPVASVCLFGEVPIEQIDRVYLDYQSRTSVMLLKILLKGYWEKEVEFVQAQSEDYIDKITGTTGGLIIGDRALEQRQQSKFCYDLGEAWKLHTGLPFVFAAWISNKKLADNFISAFNEANRYGLDCLEKVIQESPYKYFDLKKYYKEHINYTFDLKMKKGLDQFLSKLS